MSIPKKALAVFILFAQLVALSTCDSLSQTRTEKSSVRNIVLMIGDGMGLGQIGMLIAFARNGRHSRYQDRTTALERIFNEGQLALSMTNPYGVLVADSAASATQLASGQWTRSEMIGTDINGEPVQTILEYARSLSKSTGLITDTRLTHATPAAFAAHQGSRTREDRIAEQMLANQVDVLLGGGLRYWLPASANTTPLAHEYEQMIGESIPLRSGRNDNLDLLAQARALNYQLVFNREQLLTAGPGRLLGLFADSAMPDAIQAESATALSDPPALAEMTRKALQILSKDPDGFFLMVEGGQIDWAGHGNDAGTLLHEMLRFDTAVETVLDWAARRRDTLVIVTSDHDTGAFGFSYGRHELPAPIMVTGATIPDHWFKPDFNFVDARVLDHIYDQQFSFNTLFSRFDAFPASDQNPVHLLELIREMTPFDVDLTAASRILDREANAFKVAGHTYLDVSDYPKIDDFKEFYVYGRETRSALLGRALAAHQSIVWGTGTHTHTPVVVAAKGPKEWQQQFHGLMHHTDIGQLMFRALAQKE